MTDSTSKIDGRYPNPNLKSRRGYLDAMYAHNKGYQDGMRLCLEESGIHTHVSEHLLAVTGSDGRCERAASPHLEIMLMTEAKKQSTNIISLVSIVRELVQRVRGKFGRSSVEVKKIGDEEQRISYFHEEDKQPALWPSRIIDATPVVGDEHLLHLAQKQLLDEMKGQNGRKMLHRVRGRYKEYREVTKNDGVERYKDSEIQHFNLAEGVAYFDPDQGTAAFKYGPCRTVQLWIDSELIRLLRIYLAHGSQESSLRSEWLLRNLPADIKNKLAFLGSEGELNLSPESVEELVGHYEYFVWKTHGAEYDYLVHGHRESSFDPVEVRERVEDLLAMTKGRLTRDQ